MIHALARCALALLVLFLTATANAQATPGGNWRADIRDYAQQLIDAGLAPGLSVAVVAGDRVVDHFGIGIADIDNGRPVDEGTRFYIASTTKALTATAVVLLAAEGRIALDAPVTRYLPELVLGEGMNTDEVTIHDLLAMTEGIHAA
ncbi:MAG: serine hydrolase domain-containing protein [Pseudomonadota bacterium]